MKNEDRIVALLSEILIRQDRFDEGLKKLSEGLMILASSQKELVTSQKELVSSQEKLIAIQERQEKILINILEVLADDVPKFDELIEMEQLEGGKKVVLRKYRQ